MTEHERAHLVTLRQQGLTYKEIAAQVGKHYTTVFHALAGHVPAVKDTRAPIAALLRKRKQSYEAIAAALGYKNAASARSAVHQYEERQRRIKAYTTPWD